MLKPRFLLLSVSVLVQLGMTHDASAQPVLTRQPTNTFVSIGANVTFRVTATSATPPITYQWRFNSTPLPDRTNALLTITNVTTIHAGDYDVLGSDANGSTQSQSARLDVDPTFTKITTGPVVSSKGLSIGSAWTDFDNDGDLDLFITSSSGRNNSLFQNEGDGTFTRITQGSMVNTRGDYRSGSWIDFDNDGDLDLYASNTGSYGCDCPQNYFYRNDGAGKFTSLSTAAVGDVVGPLGFAQNAGFADIDRDGFLDLILIRAGKDLFFRNSGDDTLKRVVDSPFEADVLDNYSAAWSDYNDDGYPDLFVAAMGSGNDRLYRNNHDGSFTRITSGPIATARSASYGPAWMDYNNDGLPDLFVANGQGLPQSLYRNEGTGNFSRVASGELATLTGDFYFGTWGDYDNDGFQDVFLCQRGRAHNALFRNRGDGTFARITTGSPVNEPGNSVTASWGDYDDDGFLDLVVANGGGDAEEYNFLYRNNGNSNAWLKVNLIGTVSNRSALGARVRVRATLGNREMWQLREITDPAVAGKNSSIAHFGLGNATVAEQVRIEWPSGTITELRDVPARQFLTIIEPPRLSAPLVTGGISKLILRGGTGFTYTLEASDDLATWIPFRTNTAARLTLEFNETEMLHQPRRFYRARRVE